jgi:hypothetical protein
MVFILNIDKTIHPRGDYIWRGKTIHLRGDYIWRGDYPEG